METSIIDLVVSLIITAVAYTALPLIFAAIYPPPMSKKLRTISAIACSATVYLVFTMMTESRSSTHSVAPAFVWTFVSIWLMKKITNKKIMLTTGKVKRKDKENSDISSYQSYNNRKLPIFSFKPVTDKDNTDRNEATSKTPKSEKAE